MTFYFYYIKCIRQNHQHVPRGACSDIRAVTAPAVSVLIGQLTFITLCIISLA